MDSTENTPKTAFSAKRCQDSLRRWVKHPQVWGFAISVAVIYLISLVYFMPDNLEHNTLQQADMQQGAANGREGQDYEALTGEKALWTNSLFSGMPTFQISPSYPSNALFTWLNDVYGGFLPSPSNLLFMMMVGFLILLVTMRMRWYYALLGAIAWGFSSYYMIIIGAGHIWKFVTLTYIPPTIAGLVLCYRGRYLGGSAMTAIFAMLQLNANHPQMSYYFAFVMAGFAIAYLCEAIKERKMKRWVIATCCVTGAGALAVCANLPSLYNTYEYARETKRAQSELTPLTAATNAQPGVDTPRPTGGMPYNDIVGWSYGGDEVFTLLIPNFKGGASAVPEAGHLVPASLNRLDKAAEMDETTQYFLQYFPQYFNDSEGTNGPVYVGAIIIALFILGCIVVRGPMKWVLVALTLLSILLALGRNFPALTDFMIYNFPMYNKFRAVESILVIAEFTIPLLAVMGLHTVLTMGYEERRKKAWAVGVSFGLPMIACLLVWMFPTLTGDTVTTGERAMLAQLSQQGGDPEYVRQLIDDISALRLDLVASDAARSLLFLVWGGLLVLAGIMYRIKDYWIVGAVSFVVLIDLYTVDKRYVMSDAFVSTTNYDYTDPLAPDAIDQLISQDKDKSYRVLDIPGFGDARRSYHHKMIGGYHAAKLNRYEDLIQRRMSGVLDYGYMPSLRIPDTVATYTPDEQEIIKELVADYRVLDMLNTRYIITGNPEAPVVVNSHALGNAWLVDTILYVDNADAEMEALSKIDPATTAIAHKSFAPVLGESTAKQSATGSITLTEYTPNKLTYSVESPGEAIAVFSEIYFPWGWHAAIDGKEASLGRVDYVLRALRMPAGKHTVTMTFDPQSLHITGSVAYAAVTLIYLLVLLALFVHFTATGKSARADIAGEDKNCQ